MRTNRKALLLGASMATVALASVAHAQNEAETAEYDDQIIVTGIRGGLERSADQKRNASGLIEAVAAEDLGKFPDQNIAESLQRVPGITIDRNGGEGQFVSVRGFGPNFNTVLVNGRRVASEVGNREFSFDLFPSELISGAEIYKSGAAHLQEGGIGATIDLSTARPLDHSGFRGVLTGRGVYDINAEQASPQVFGLISNTMADDTIGFLLSASYQERESAIATYDNRAWNTGSVADLVASGATVTNPSGAESFFVAQNLQLGTINQKRERLNLQAVAQYQPNEEVLLTVDGMWNEFDLTSETSFLNNWFGLGSLDNFVLDENGTATSFFNPDGAVEARAQTDGRKTQTQLVGINLEWTPSSEFQHGFDASYTHSENSPENGDTGQNVLGFNTGYTYTQGNTPLPQVTWPFPVATALDRDNFLFHVAQFGGDGDQTEGGNTVDSEIFEARYDGVYTPDIEGVKKIGFGLRFGDESKDVSIRRTDQQLINFVSGFFIDIPAGVQDELLFPVTVDLLNQGDGGFVDSNGNIVNTYLGNLVVPSTLAINDPAIFAARDAALSLAPGTSEALFISRGGFAPQERPESFSVDERIFSAYVDMALEGDVGNVPWEINAGVRFVNTKTTSVGAVTPLTDIRINVNDPTEFLQVLGNTSDFILTQESEYNFLLPNFDLKLELADGLIARLGASQTMSRPQLTDLSPRLAILNTRPNNLVAAGGNPFLQPFSSTNLDLSFEYYFDSFSYLAISGFWKEVDDFVVQTTAPEVLQIANVDNIVDPRIDGTDATFDVTRPTNAETARVKGLEISGQLGFTALPAPFDGFGVQGAVLIVDSNAEIGQNTAERVAFGLPGLSNAQNVQFFYSKGPLDARISYNRRGKFLETVANVFGGEPIFVDAFAQVDFKVNYTIADRYSVFVEGTNVFDEQINKTGRFANQFVELTDTGPRYAAGFRAEF